MSSESETNIDNVFEVSDAMIVSSFFADISYHKIHIFSFHEFSGAEKPFK